MNVIMCSGALCYSLKTSRFLLLQKGYGKHYGTWGVVGGKLQPHESPIDGLKREVYEETNFSLADNKIIPLETFISSNKVFHFYTYMCIVNDEFIPILSDEHIGWAWATLHNFPTPMHPGLKQSLNSTVVRTKIETVITLLNRFCLRE